MVQSRPRYMSGWMPRVKGCWPGGGCSEPASAARYTAFSGMPLSFTRPSLSEAILDQLREDAGRRLRMQEDDRGAVDAPAHLARLLEPRRQQALQLPGQVGHRVGQVVQPGAALGHELADRGPGVVGAEQLQLGASAVEEGELELLEAAPPPDLGAQDAGVELHGGVDVGDRDADVMEPQTSARPRPATRSGCGWCTRSAPGRPWCSGPRWPGSPSASACPGACPGWRRAA